MDSPVQQQFIGTCPDAAAAAMTEQTESTIKRKNIELARGNLAVY